MPVIENLIKEVRKECKFLGNNNLADDIVDKICQLCLENRITAQDFVSSWIAFVSTKKLSNPDLTLDLLDQLNKDELSKPINNKTNDQKYEDFNEMQDETLDESNDDLLETYGTPLMKEQAKKRQITPNVNLNKRRIGQKRSPVIFSPTNSSPETFNTTSRYTTRTNSGDVLVSFGNTTNVKWENNDNEFPVNVHVYDEASILTKKYPYLYEKLPIKAQILNQWLEDMGLQLHKIHDLSFTAPSEIRMAEKQTVLGRVWSDGLGKLNVKHLHVESPLYDGQSSSILLDLSNLSQFSLFPGQLLAIEGIKTQENFMVEKIYDGIMLPFSQYESNSKESQSELHVVVATGPYTTTDDCTYSPLMDLLNYLEKHQPHACILIGPFVDSKSDALSKHFDVQNSELCSYNDVFESLIKTIVDKINSSKTQLIIIPSLRDLHHPHFVYPTAPFSHPEVNAVHFMPDPCVLDINGVVIGITSVDVLFHLGKEELNTGSTDRLGRLAAHILKQQNFYPLCPPHEDVNIDYKHFDLHGGLPVTPDILILPSDFKHFIKNIQSCCCINPERLVKGVCGGTFARIHVQAHTRTKGSSISEKISAQIIKI